MTAPANSLKKRLHQVEKTIDLSGAMAPRGVVRKVGDGVALVAGLPDVGYEELLMFDSGALGMALDLREDGAGAVLLAGAERVVTGEGVAGLGCLPDVCVGEEVLGRLLDPLGNALDDGPPLATLPRWPLFRPAPEITERKGVDQPLWSGTMVIDASIPIGRGQRELIIGDRNVGKTSLALDIVTAQKRGDVACVYVVIGQPMSRVLAIRDALARLGCLENTAIITADASATPAIQYLAPYAGATVAEWFREQGRHALVIYDDLTKHADAYRELALLLDRPPGREAYPGDIFYIHAELLERATARRADRGGGSVTAFPLVETTDNDIAAYIPTNLISITDGQIYLETARFERGQRPAVDIGRSVSRIGAVAQPPAIRVAARNLRILISRFEALETLTRVGLDVDAETLAVVRRGRVMREALRQERFSGRGVAEQFLMLSAVTAGWLDAVELAQVQALLSTLVFRARSELTDLVATLDAGQMPADGWKDRLAELTRAIVESAGRSS